MSFVFSTATQPAFRRSPSLQEGFQPGEVTEISGDASILQNTFGVLDRVRYSDAGALDWKAVAAEMVAEPRVLCVVNTRRQAFDLWETLRDALLAEGRASLFHLSSALCPAHRLSSLGATHAPREGTIRHRLLAGLPCRVVSTQVVEAGVDLDFPVVLRAMGPLDSIVQAAGRCNREGRLPAPQKGRVIVFSPTDGGLPPGVYKTATGHTASFLAKRGLSGLGTDPAQFAEYFSGLFGLTDTDYARRHECTIQEDRQWLRFKDVARKARVIAEDTTPVVVPYGKGEEVIQTIRARERPPGAPRYDRQDQRTLQLYTVNLRRNDFLKLQANKAIAPLLPNLEVHVLDSACYHADLGVVIDRLPTEDLCGV
jgi:CRISPR-associated endonuclease/helicase Cas3